MGDLNGHLNPDLSSSDWGPDTYEALLRAHKRIPSKGLKLQTNCDASYACPRTLPSLHGEGLGVQNSCSFTKAVEELRESEIKLRIRLAGSYLSMVPALYLRNHAVPLMWQTYANVQVDRPDCIADLG